MLLERERVGGRVSLCHLADTLLRYARHAKALNALVATSWAVRSLILHLDCRTLTHAFDGKCRTTAGRAVRLNAVHVDNPLPWPQRLIFALFDQIWNKV